MTNSLRTLIAVLPLLDAMSCDTSPTKRGPHSAAVVLVKPIEWSAGPVDNSACLSCHKSFGTESMAAGHLEARVTCAVYHGASGAHRLGKTLLPEADLVWGRKDVEALCKECHTGHKSPLKVLSFRLQWAGKTRPNGRRIAAGSICTDCHGEHTMCDKG